MLTQEKARLKCDLKKYQIKPKVKKKKKVFEFPINYFIMTREFLWIQANIFGKYII